MVQVLGLDGDNVVVVAQFACLSGETQVGDGGDCDAAILGSQAEAVGPGVLGLVLQVQGERLVLEVGETKLGGDRSVAESTGLEITLVLTKS